MLICTLCCEHYSGCRNCVCGERTGQICELCGKPSSVVGAGMVRNCTLSGKVLNVLKEEFEDRGKACKTTERQIIRIDVTDTALYGHRVNG